MNEFELYRLFSGMLVPYLNDARMPGWLGWQKYSIKDDGVDIHYVGHCFLPVRFDYKIK